MKYQLAQFQSHFQANPEYYLLGLSSLVAALLVLLLWQSRRARIDRDNRQRQLIEQLELLRDDLLDNQEARLRHALDSVQHALQSLQAVLSDKIGALEKDLLRDAAQLKIGLAERFEAQKNSVAEALSDARLTQQRELTELKQALESALSQHRESVEKQQREAIHAQQQTLSTTLNAMSGQIQETFRQSAGELGKRVEGLTRTTDERLREITGQVEKRLSEGFEKTTETFTRVLEHLTRIDEAQKKIVELSGNVISLQEVLTDKRSRGAFGEVQLAGLVRNILPEGSFEMQATLSNGKRVDCLIRLPDPTGDVPIDAKFPLESFQRMMDTDRPEGERVAASSLFRRDIRKHIADISGKYLVPGETSDGAVMFLPAEAVFAEIHAHFPELVEEAQRARVWMVSPTTLMAVLTTARSVLKDDATRKQIHVIQEHLRRLAEDFGRFQHRMDKLATHIRQAKEDVDQVHTSARKITSRFTKIENAEVQLPRLEDD